MKRVIHFVAFLMLLVLPALPVQSAYTTVPDAETALETTCPKIVQHAWENVDTLCQNMDRNEACYGHMLLDAQPQPDVAHFAFEREGQTIEVAKLRSLRLSTMDLLNGTWGVALMQIQANLPATATDQYVSLLLFGNVTIENVVADVPLVDVAPRSARNTINVRRQPTTRSGVVGLVGPNDVVTADGRLAGGSWLHVQLAETGASGWVYAPLFESVDGAALDTLHEVDAGAGSSNYGPMQAFYFESGTNDAMCPEAPNSGILIQTPEGVAEVTLLINEVDIQLGSTVYFQAQPGDEMTVSVVEGHARVTVGGETQTAFAGTQVGVPLDGAGNPSGPPAPPRPYEMVTVRSLPVEQMEIPVVIADPVSGEEVPAAVAREDETAAVPVPVFSEGNPLDDVLPGDDGEQPEHENDIPLPGDDNGDLPPDESNPPPGVGNPPPGVGDPPPGSNPSPDVGNPPPGVGDPPPGSNPSPDDGDPAPEEDDDLPPGLIDNPGLGDNLPPGHGGDGPPGQSNP